MYQRNQIWTIKKGLIELQWPEQWEENIGNRHQNSHTGVRGAHVHTFVVCSSQRSCFPPPCFCYLLIFCSWLWVCDFYKCGTAHLILTQSGRNKLLLEYISELDERFIRIIWIRAKLFHTSKDRGNIQRGNIYGIKHKIGKRNQRESDCTWTPPSIKEDKAVNVNKQ